MLTLSVLSLKDLKETHLSMKSAEIQNIRRKIYKLLKNKQEHFKQIDLKFKSSHLWYTGNELAKLWN